MKQTLKITKFLGRSENAVRTQIAVALIAHLLLCALQKLSQQKIGFLELVQLLRANLMHRKDPTRLRQCQPRPPIELTATRTETGLCMKRTAVGLSRP